MRRNRLWIIASVVILVIAAGAGYLLGVKPQLDAAAVADKESVAVDAQNQALQTDIDSLREQYTRLPEIQAQLDELRLAIPTSGDIEIFFGQMHALEQEHGVTVTAFTAADAASLLAGDAATGEAAADEEAADEEASTDPSGFVTIPVSVTVEGSKEGVMGFIQGLQSGTRLLLASNLAVANAEEGPSIVADVTGLLYALLEPGTAPPVVEAAPAQ